jgi:hypothetical protein
MVAEETAELVTEAGFPQECGNFLFHSSVLLSIKFCHGRKHVRNWPNPASHQMPTGDHLLGSGVKRQGREDDNSTFSNADDRNGGAMRPPSVRLNGVTHNDKNYL